MSIRTELNELFPCGDAVAYAEQQLENGETDEAAWTCRALLSDDELNDDDRERIETLLERTADRPVGWKEAVLEWAEDPSVEDWRELMQFVDVDDYYDRVRDAYAFLRPVDVDADLLFRCLAEDGLTSDVQELVATGEVAPETVAERADKAPAASRGMWLALAARAAAAGGDDLGVIRWLTRAYDTDTDPQLVEMMSYELWAGADEQLRSILRDQNLAPEVG